MMKTDTITPQQIIDLVMTLPPDRLPSVYDFTLFVKQHPLPLTPRLTFSVKGRTKYGRMRSGGINNSLHPATS